MLKCLQCKAYICLKLEHTIMLTYSQLKITHGNRHASTVFIDYTFKCNMVKEIPKFGHDAYV